MVGTQVLPRQSFCGDLIPYYEEPLHAMIHRSVVLVYRRPTHSTFTDGMLYSKPTLLLLHPGLGQATAELNALYEYQSTNIPHVLANPIYN